MGLAEKSLVLAAVATLTILWPGEDMQGLCLPQGMGEDPSLGQEQDAAADLERTAMDMNIGDRPRDHGYGQGGQDQMNIPESGGGGGNSGGNGGGGKGADGGKEAGAGSKGGAVTQAGEGTGKKAVKKKDKKGKDDKEEKSFSEQSKQAVLQFGVLVGVSLLVAGLFFLNVGLEVAMVRISEKMSNFFGRHKSDDIEEQDPAALVGTFKRYK